LSPKKKSSKLFSVFRQVNKAFKTSSPQKVI